MPDLSTTIANVRRDGEKRDVRCPAHPDERASLSVDIGNEDRVLVYCHAGCDTRDVVAAAGITMADLAPGTTGRGTSSQEIVAIYDYTDENGELLYQVVRFEPKDFRQRRPDGADGWVWNTKGVRRVLFGLPELAGARTVYIAEGEKDVLALRQLGLSATTNSGGASKWRDDYTQQLCAAGVEAVIVLPDNDDAGRKHANVVARSCRSGGLTATIVELPGLPEHGDVTDWIKAGHTADELEALLERAAMDDAADAAPGRPIDASGGQANQSAVRGAPHSEDELILDAGAPLDSARMFVSLNCVVDGVLTLRHQAGVFYQYKSRLNTYIEREESVIRAALYHFLEKAQRREENELVPFDPTKAKVDNVLDALRALGNLPASSASPCWIDIESDLDPFDIMPCRNGLLHVPSRRLLPRSPNFFTVNGLEFDFDPDAPAPTHFLRFLEDLWPDDRESKDCLLEWIGYLLTPRTHLQKILMLVGPKRSGKGTIGRLITHLIGKRNVCAPTLAGMSIPFGLWALMGKAVAIIADARIGGRTDTAIVAERLLSISGEDIQSVSRKFLPDWTGRIGTRFMLLTNELPRIEDASGALVSRFVVLTLKQSFYGREDQGLFDRFIPELPGILNLALDGADRLRARDYFKQPEASESLIQDFEDLGSPIAAFLRDCCDVARGYEVTHKELYGKWRHWCVENGRDKPGTVQTFGRNLRAAVRLGESFPRESGERVRYYQGIRLKDGAAE